MNFKKEAKEEKWKRECGYDIKGTWNRAECDDLQGWWRSALRQHFLDMGMIPGAEITVVKFAPMGDPMELQIHGYELTLRLAEADQIEVEPIRKRSRSHEATTEY